MEASPLIPISNKGPFTPNVSDNSAMTLVIQFSLEKQRDKKIKPLRNQS